MPWKPRCILCFKRYLCLLSDFRSTHQLFDLNSNLQRIAARQEFWNSKLEQLDQQRDRINQNTVNSIHVAQQSFSPEVLVATHNNKPSSELLHMQRKVSSSRSSCNFDLARKLEDEMQMMLVQRRVSRYQSSFDCVLIVTCLCRRPMRKNVTLAPLWRADGWWISMFFQFRKRLPKPFLNSEHNKKPYGIVWYDICRCFLVL